MWLVGKRLFAVLAFLAGGIAAAAGAALAEPPAERQKKLLYLLEQDCGSCHGLTMKGGLGPALLPQTLSGKPDDMLVDTILHGRPGTPMPPWSFEITPEEAQWLVERLRTGRTNG
jgi:cytochrome c55X